MTVHGPPLIADIIEECRRRGCRYSYRHDPRIIGKVILQHGENPESVVLVDDVYPGTAAEAAGNAARIYYEFADRCHRYEDGEVSA